MISRSSCCDNFVRLVAHVRYQIYLLPKDGKMAASTFEAIRLQNIDKNNKFLEQIGLAGGKSRLPNDHHQQGSSKRKKTFKENDDGLTDNLHIRKSSRIAGIPSVDYKVRTKHLSFHHIDNMGTRRHQFQRSQGNRLMLVMLLKTLKSHLT